MQDWACLEYFIDAVLRTLKYMTPGILKVKQNKNQTTHLNAYSVPGRSAGVSFCLILPFPFRDCKTIGLTRNPPRSFREAEGERDASEDFLESGLLRKNQAWVAQQGPKPGAGLYLCALPSPLCRSSMISGTVWAGSLGLSRYSRTFLPYLSFTMLGKELMIS